jgi:hypothetical protein
MSDTDGQMIQASFKTRAGTLINAKGYDESTFRMSLAVIHDYLSEITDVEDKIAAVENVKAALAPAPTAPAPSGWDAPASFTDATAPTCTHGPRTARSGVGKKGPYRAWFCNTPQGAVDKCAPIFLNKGTPEWDSFPA